MRKVYYPQTHVKWWRKEGLTAMLAAPGFFKKGDHHIWIHVNSREGFHKTALGTARWCVLCFPLSLASPPREGLWGYSQESSKIAL